MKILIADDTQFNLLIAKKFISHSFVDAEVETCIDGLQALNKTLETKFDLILLDIQMPEMDGETAMLKIRANENNANCNTPIIALTGSANDNLCAEGFNDVLLKPIELPALVRKVEQFTKIEEKV